MDAQSTLFLFVSWGHLAQTAVSVLLAGFLFFFAHSYRQRFLLDWSWSWGGLGLYHLSAALVLATEPFTGTTTATILASAASQIGGFLHVTWLVWGMLSLTRDERPRRTLYVPSLVAAALVGVATTLLTVSSNLDTRLLVRVGFYGLAVSGAFTWLALTMRARNRAQVSLGARVLGCAAVLYALEHLLYFYLRLAVSLELNSPLAHFFDIPQNSMVALLLINLVLLTSIALGTAVWLLEEERTRLKESSDILRRSQARLRKAHRLEAIGRLAGGLAHDFNNLMTTVLGYSQLLLTRFSPDDPLSKDLEEIQTAGERAAQMTRQLLAFSRRQVLRPEVFDANEVLRRLASGPSEEMPRSRTSQHEVELELEKGLWPISADASQLEQVLRSVIENAFDAMPAGGRVSVSSANVQMSASDVETLSPMPAGRYVEIRVGDEGVGMDRSILEQLFEPFFSTKERGKGAGLGLATAYGVVKQSGGYIFAQSEVDRGSVIRIFLPPATREDAQRMIKQQWDPRRGLVGTETVLVVEDDTAVRGLVEAILSGQGYHVLVASDGREALDTASRAAADLSLVVTDMVLPDLSGPEVVDGLRQLVPEIKVIYMSGHSGDEVLLRAGASHDAPFLEKPFTAERLLSEVRRTLES